MKTDQRISQVHYFALQIAQLFNPPTNRGFQRTHLQTINMFLPQLPLPSGDDAPAPETGRHRMPQPLMGAELICRGAQKDVFALGTDQAGQEFLQVAGRGLLERGTYHGPDASAKKPTPDIKSFGRV
jgi:hypothetical protein